MAYFVLLKAIDFKRTIYLISNMTENDQLLQKLKKFMGITFLVFFLACVAGAVGGWLVYSSAAAGSRVMGIDLLVPTIVATIVSCIVLVIVKKKLFASKQEFEAAVQLFKEKNEKPK